MLRRVSHFWPDVSSLQLPGLPQDLAFSFSSGRRVIQPMHPSGFVSPWRVVPSNSQGCIAMKPRPVTIEGDVAYVTLTKGYVAVIDAADVHLVEGRNWYALMSPKNSTVYARRSERFNDGKWRHMLLHRVILGLTYPDIEVDHRDGDGLNNRRSNLRECCSSQNKQNVRRRRDNTSGHKGVHWNARSKKWQVNIKVFGSRKHLGYFETLEDACAAYTAAADQFHGTFARVA